MRKKILLLVFGGVVVAALATGCSRSVELQTKFVEVKELFVSPSQAEIAINSEYQFYAIAVDKDGNPSKVSAEWSLYGTVGTIDASGLFKSLTKAGTALVTAKYGAFQASAYVTVKPGSLAKLTVSPSSVTLAVGDSYTFTATGEDSYGNEVDVSPTWSVEGGIGSFSDYYDFSSKGIRYMSSSYSAYSYFTATAAGSGTVKAQVGSIEARASVQVISITPYTYVTQWQTKVGTESAIAKGAAIDSSGNIWVGMYTYSYSGGYEYNGYVAKYDSSGNFISSLEGAASGEGSLKVPNDIAFDSSGNIYVVDYEGDKIKKYDSSGNFLLSWGGSGSSSGKFYHPARIAIDSRNYVYVTDNGNDRVQKFDSSGNYILEWGSYGSDPGEFKNPTGIAIGSDGYIYVADQENYRIQKFSSSGSYITSWGSYGSGIGQFGSLVGVTIDSSNNLFVTDYSYNRVYKYDNAGNFITRWGSYGRASGKFSSPMDVAVDGSGNVYVVDTYNYRIQKFQP
ncbi:MAG: 6-bladed beta-propeller [Anaerolineales bacterium]